MVPFAAKFGFTEEDLGNQEIEDRLRDELARSYGYDPRGTWILVIHADDSTDMYRFEHLYEMWCCDLRHAIRAAVDAEVRVYGPPGTVTLAPPRWAAS